MNDFDFEIPDLIGKILPHTNDLKILSIIGYGSFAVVYKAEDAQHNLYAVKCIVKKGLNSLQLELQYREAELLNRLKEHPNIINLYQVIDTEENLFFVLDLCECDLFEAIVHNHGFGNQYTKEVFEIIIDTVQYLHERKIYHRDLKPENILITMDGDIKIADFGLACSDNWSKDFDCGTLRYEPPECVDLASKGYSPEKSDLWALGVILVNLRFERNPWTYASDEDNIYYEYSNNNCDILQQQLGLSNEMNEILKNIFQVNPEQRWSLSELKEAFSKIEEMYDETKYNPIQPKAKKSNCSSPIPITPNSRKGSPFSSAFSSSNSSTYNNSPGFIRQYEDHMEKGGAFNEDNISEQEFTFNEQTYVNSRYDEYFLNKTSSSHFSFCPRDDEDEDDIFEEDQDQDEDENIIMGEGEEEEEEEEHNEKEKGKGKNKKEIHRIFTKEKESEPYYLEDELYSPKDNKLYRSIKKGSICSRHNLSIRSNGSCSGGVGNGHFNPFRENNNHVKRPTPLRINTNIFYSEEEDAVESSSLAMKKKTHQNEKTKPSLLKHEVPESWEDYSYDELLSDSEETSSISSAIVVSQLKIKTPQQQQQQQQQHQSHSINYFNGCSSPAQISTCSDKIASYYKEQLIGSPSYEEKNIIKFEDKFILDENDKKGELEIKECDKKEEEEEEVKECDEKEENVYKIDDDEKGNELIKASKEKIVKTINSDQGKAIIVREYGLYNPNEICTSTTTTTQTAITQATTTTTTISTSSHLYPIPKISKSVLTQQRHYQWNINITELLVRHSFLICQNEISVLNIKKHYQPNDYSFLIKYYFPQLPLYLLYFSFQLIDRVKRLSSSSSASVSYSSSSFPTVERDSEEKETKYDNEKQIQNLFQDFLLNFMTNEKDGDDFSKDSNSILHSFFKVLIYIIDLYKISVNTTSNHVFNSKMQKAKDNTIVDLKTITTTTTTTTIHSTTNHNTNVNTNTNNTIMDKTNNPILKVVDFLCCIKKNTTTATVKSSSSNKNKDKKKDKSYPPLSKILSSSYYSNLLHQCFDLTNLQSKIVLNSSNTIVTTTLSYLDYLFLFLYEKLKLFILIRSITLNDLLLNTTTAAATATTTTLATAISTTTTTTQMNCYSIHPKLYEKYLTIFHQFFFKTLYLLLKTTFI